MNSKQGIIVLGCGGHAKVCIELLQSMGEEVAYCIGSDDNSILSQCMGVKVLIGNDKLINLKQEGYFRAFIAIGSNTLRKSLGEFAVKQGYSLVNAISPHAIISPSAIIGNGVAVMSGVVINAETKIGDLTIINTGATVDHDCCIGDFVHIAPQSALAGCVMVGDNSFLGIGCKVIPNIMIGAGVVVGAGGVVIRDVLSGCKVVGVPAK